jgi:N-acyl-D-amino-acid deacylase
MWRRLFVGLARSLTVSAATSCGFAASPGPIGCISPGLEPFDAAMTRLIHEWDLSGGGLAVSHNGRMVVARGHGLADKATRAPVTPRTRFRLGSLSKPITAVAILKLVEEGKLRLDDPVLPLLGNLVAPAEAVRDPRVHTITVRHLLQHTGGFDRYASGDPMFMPRAAAAIERQRGKPPPTCALILRNVLDGPLDFVPGTREVYSNLGYCILGRIVERVSGIPYEEFARSRLLQPAGASGLRVGRTMTAAPDEATYYDHADAPKVEAMPGVAEGLVARPYGQAAIEEMDSYGGWIGTPSDYLRFLLAIDGQRGPRLLSEASVGEMLSPPNMPGADPGRPVYYALGITVRQLEGGAKNWWHTGHQPGFYAFALRTARGHSWVAAFNSAPRDLNAFFSDLDSSLWAAARVTRWPGSNSKSSCET